MSIVVYLCVIGSMITTTATNLKNHLGKYMRAVRAAMPMPTTLGTLDAIHLATALELAPSIDGPMSLATHDEQLARAARASGMDVVGV